jgi:V/A-type H+-transporting ATPase subunit E
MAGPGRIEQLEAALRERAEKLAEAHRRRARQESRELLAAAERRLADQRRREHEAATRLAQGKAREYMQAGELRLQADLDRLRWALVEEILGRLETRLPGLRSEPAVYRRMLADWIREGARWIDAPSLVVAVNAQDQGLLEPDWASWSAGILDGRKASLELLTRPTAGGVLLRSPDDTVRVDNTFEGRLDRLRESLQQLILEELFSALPDHGAPGRV